MWVSAIDVQKAFGSIQHDATWRSLTEHSISDQYICLLKKLYADQRATVLTDWTLTYSGFAVEESKVIF